MPAKQHQQAVYKIQQSIQPAPQIGDVPAKEICGCYQYADVYIQFPDGSLKRPDISSFCTDPSEEYEAIKQVPDAVVEVISKGYKLKDFELGRLCVFDYFYINNHINHGYS